MSERDYLERTIATVRNHRWSENSWTQWANIFADEIERLWSIEEQYATLLTAARTYLAAWDKGEDAIKERRALSSVAFPASRPRNV